MKERFYELPAPLQKQIAIRIVGGAVFLLLFVIILLGFRDFYFSLPCLLLSGFLLINGIRLCYNSFAGNCEKIETVGLRKRTKGIWVQLEGNVVKIPIRQRMKVLSIGDTVIIYLSDKTPVYEHEGNYMICSYYALGIEKRGN